MYSFREGTPPAPSHGDDFRGAAIRRGQRARTRLQHRHDHSILEVRVYRTRAALLLFFGSVRAILHEDHSVVGLQPAPQLDVGLTLYVHEDETACEADGHHNQFRPKRPFKDAFEIKRDRQKVITVVVYRAGDFFSL